MLAINFGPKGDGMRDTAANILRTGEFVVNIANQSLLHALHASSAVYPPEESEAETLGLATSESATVAPPRISAAPAGMECVLQKCIFLGERNYALIIGEVKRFFVRDDLVVNGKIATTALDPVVRIAGPTYARLGELITMPRAFPMPRENA